MLSDSGGTFGTGLHSKIYELPLQCVLGQRSRKTGNRACLAEHEIPRCSYGVAKYTVVQGCFPGLNSKVDQDGWYPLMRR